jgi:hypothetical protein
VGLLYTGTGVISGILAGMITEFLFPQNKYINFAVYALVIVISYLTTFLMPYLNIDMEKQGKLWKIMISNAFSYIIAFAVVWALIYELVRY